MWVKMVLVVYGGPTVSAMAPVSTTVMVSATRTQRSMMSRWRRAWAPADHTENGAGSAGRDRA